MSEKSLKVFLVHATQDKPQVRALYRRLKGDGIDAWLDEQDLLPGQDWDREISKALTQSDVIIVSVDENFVSERHFDPLNSRQTAIFSLKRPVLTAPNVPLLSNFHLLSLSI